MSGAGERVWVLRLPLGEETAYFFRFDPDGAVVTHIAPQDAMRFANRDDCSAFLARHPKLARVAEPVFAAPKPLTCDFCDTPEVVRWFGCETHTHTAQEQVAFAAARGVSLHGDLLSDITWFNEWGACAACAPLVEIGPEAVLARCLELLRNEMEARRAGSDYFRFGKMALELAQGGFWKHRRPEKDRSV